MLTGNIQGIRFKMKHFMDTSIAWITCIIYEAQFVCFVICQVPFCDMSGSVLWCVRFCFVMCQVPFCDASGSVLWCVRFRFVMCQVPFCDVSGSVLWYVRFRFVICWVLFCDMSGSLRVNFVLIKHFTSWTIRPTALTLEHQNRIYLHY